MSHHSRNSAILNKLVLQGCEKVSKASISGNLIIQIETFLLLNLNSYPSSSFPFSCYSHGFFKCLRIPLIHNKVVHGKNKNKEP